MRKILYMNTLKVHIIGTMAYINVEWRDKSVYLH